MTDPSAIYQIVLLLHIAASIVGFGGIIAHSAYNAKAFGGTAGGASVLLNTTQLVTSFAHYAIYGVFVLGVAIRDEALRMSEHTEKLEREYAHDLKIQWPGSLPPLLSDKDRLNRSLAEIDLSEIRRYGT